MSTNKARRLAAALLSATLAGAGAVSAAPIEPDFGTYDMGDAFSSHGLWFSDELVDTDGNGLSTAAQRWSVETATLTYTDNGGVGLNTLTIDGVVEHNGYRLGFDFDLVEIAHAGDPACGVQAGCGLAPVGDATQDHYDGVKFFGFPGLGALSTASIFGLDSLAGLTFDLSIAPGDGSKPPQFGYCANWVDCLLGYSNWFYFARSDQNLFKVAIDGRGNGDVNLTASPVPLPATGWMLIAGLGALAMRRRKAA